MASPQRAFPFPDVHQPLAMPPPTLAEKRAQRTAQGEKCATCGGKSKGAALDVVRRQGALVALCRRDRLRWDAPWRCRKGASKRRRGTRGPSRALPPSLPMPMLVG